MLVEFHEAANIFPMMTGDDFQALVEDIRANGLHEPITLYQGKILDGRNRYAACLELGIEPHYREWNNGSDPLAYVVSLNLIRRHLTKDQQREIMREMRARGCTYQDIAEATGVSIGTAYNYAGDIELFNNEKLKGDDGKYRPPFYTPRQEPEKRPVSYHVSDDSYEWFTPAEYIEAARGVMGSIDLDPASCDVAQETIQAGEYYTKDDDGLSRTWFGNVWLNPPYNMPLVQQFTGRAIDDYKAGAIGSAIVLVNNSTDTEWFHRLLEYPVCFTNGRIKFWNIGEILGARQGQAIFYLGDNPDLFARVFSAFGAVMRRYDNK